MDTMKRLTSLGLTLPEPPEPAGSYARAVCTGNLIFVSGQLPVSDGKIAFSGTVGDNLTIDEGYNACQVCALNALSILSAESGSLNNVTQIVRLTGYIRSHSGFSDQANVLNGASDLMFNIFGDKGIHARVAVGVTELPLNSAVELEVIAERAAGEIITSERIGV